MYGRPRINICKSNVWPSSHCLHFVYAHKMYVRTHAIIMGRWKSTFTSSRVLKVSPILQPSQLQYVIFLFIS